MCNENVTEVQRHIDTLKDVLSLMDTLDLERATFNSEPHSIDERRTFFKDHTAKVQEVSAKLNSLSGER